MRSECEKEIETEETERERKTATTKDYVPEKILDEKLVRGTKRYLVKWEGYPVEDSTWEPVGHQQATRLRIPTKRLRDVRWTERNGRDS